MRIKGKIRIGNGFHEFEFEGAPGELFKVEEICKKIKSAVKILVGSP